MLILLTGGSGNGKSTFAVKLLSQMTGSRYLVDTALVYDAAEAAYRDQKQLRLQEQEIFTLSCGTRLDALQFPPGSSAIVECMCHLTASEMFSANQPFVEQRDMKTVFNRILNKLSHLQKQCSNLIVVTNEVGCDGVSYDEHTESYKRLLGMLNRTLARRADCVCELVCGIPLICKGALPAECGEISAGLPHGPILVIGPENAGKRDYVRSLGYCDQDMSSHIDSPQPVLVDLQKSLMTTQDIQSILPQLLRKKVIVCNEVGSGIIPVSPELTQARVRTGALCCELTRQAASVIRVICGIPIILK